MLEAQQATPRSGIAEIKHLQEEIARLTAQAKDEALEQARAAVETLNALGFDYRLIDAAKSGGMPVKKRKAANHACTVCGFATDPHHDARKHKGQGSDQRPFTDDELTAFGLAKTG